MMQKIKNLRLIWTVPNQTELTKRDASTIFRFNIGDDNQYRRNRKKATQDVNRKSISLQSMTRETLDIMYLMYGVEAGPIIRGKWSDRNGDLVVSMERLLNVNFPNAAGLSTGSSHRPSRKLQRRSTSASTCT